MSKLNGKTALLTGGASGLAKAAGQLMAQEGARVILSDIQRVEGENVASEIRENGGIADFKFHDVTAEKDWQLIISEIVEEYGSLDILLNGAGVAGAGVPLVETDMETWRHCIAVCLDSVFLGCKYGIKAMSQGAGGSIINISSIFGISGNRGSANYCAAKGGVTVLSKAAALECAPKTPRIRVNSIHPGFIDTPMLAGAIQKRGPQFREFIEDRVPFGMIGEPKDIAEGVLYLASDSSKFVTGTELVIDGGFLAN